MNTFFAALPVAAAPPVCAQTCRSQNPYTSDGHPNRSRFEAAAQTGRCFQTACRSRHYSGAAKIKQPYPNRCSSFLRITGQMHTRSGLAASRNNAGSPAASLAGHMVDAGGFAAPYVYRESYKRGRQHARSNLKACGG
ncbi:hypothetical protein [Neisseria musculi]|uniref:Uncharacterized protein n=1 Tax=Neisseria musculi TaxID=1815583 RepID=A0A7H1M9R4_9NEIS|nr:hypothetical protein [Neisseria musculi]QNT58379.1 hypothetical protein H7A79_1931 [Neisseria musculi]